MAFSGVTGNYTQQNFPWEEIWPSQFFSMWLSNTNLSIISSITSVRRWRFLKPFENIPIVFWWLIIHFSLAIRIWWRNNIMTSVRMKTENFRRHYFYNRSDCMVAIYIYVKRNQIQPKGGGRGESPTLK